MSERRGQRGRRPVSRQGNKRGLWAAVPPPGPPEPIEPASDPTALITSLGAPPLRGGVSTAEHYLAAVVERAAGLAFGLANLAQVLATPEGDDTTS